MLYGQILARNISMNADKIFVFFYFQRKVNYFLNGKSTNPNISKIVKRIQI